jgi:hypothetical protein
MRHIGRNFGNSDRKGAITNGGQTSERNNQFRGQRQPKTTASGHVSDYMETVKQTAKRRSANTLVGEHRNFEDDTLLSAQPMKLTEQRGHVVLPTGAEYQSRSSIHDALKPMTLAGR